MRTAGRMGGGSATPYGMLARGSRRRRADRAAHRGRARDGRSHVYLAGWRFAADFAMVRGPKPVDCATFSPSSPNGSTSTCSPGPVRRCRCSDRRAEWRAPWPSSRRARGCTVPPTRRNGRCTVTTRRSSSSTIASPSSVAWISPPRAATASTAARTSHARQIGWHDVTTRIEGPAVADVAAHFRMRWRRPPARRCRRPPAPEPAGDLTLQIVRTVPEHVYERTPRGEFGILESYLRALRLPRASSTWRTSSCGRRRSPRCSATSSGDRPRRLPAPARAAREAEHGRDDTRGMLAELVEADDGAGRLLACTIYARTAR